MGAYSNTRISRSLADHTISIVKDRLEKNHIEFYVAGSYRRGKQEVGDLDFIIIDYPSKQCALIFSDLFVPGSRNRLGDKIASVVLDIDGNAVQVEFSNCPKNSIGAYLLHSTGSGDFNMILRSRAKKRGFLLNQYGLFKIIPETESRIDLGLKTEEEIFNRLGLKYIPPQDRSISSIEDAYRLFKSNSLSESYSYASRIVNLLESILIKEHDGPFILWYSDNPKYNRVISNRDYFRSKGVESDLVYMSPDKYQELVAKGFGVSLEKSKSKIDKEKVYKYIQMIKEGHRFPCPILSYNIAGKSFLQEGRHRAEACKLAGIDKIPVWIITSKTNVNNEIDNSYSPISNNAQQYNKIFNIWNTPDLGKYFE